MSTSQRLLDKATQRMYTEDSKPSRPKEFAMAEKYRKKPPTYEAAQLTRENEQEVIALFRRHSVRAEASWWRDLFSVDVIAEERERPMLKDFRRMYRSKPSFPVSVEEGDWVVVSRNGIEIHSQESFEERFERDI